jgi:hypothetical protein
MLYLDYAKPLADGKYILSFFADSAADLESISHGQKFVTKNGTDYGVPQAGSTVIVTSPNSGKTTYVMDAEGVWVVTEDISYSAVVANPSDAATAKLEKLKVNDTTYANWTESEIKALAGKGEDGVGVTSFETVSSTVVGDNTNTTVRAHYSNNTTDEFVVTAKNGISKSLYFHKIYISDGWGDNIVKACFINHSGNEVSKISEIDAISNILFNIRFQPDNSANTEYIGNYLDVENDKFSIGYFLNYPFRLPVTNKKFALGIGSISDEVTAL